MVNLRSIFLVLFAVILSFSATASDEEEGNIRDPYDLFDPVPRSLMRPLNADRPDMAESPHTLDAGHFQVETSLFEYTSDQSSGAKVETYLLNAMNIKAGLNIDVDLQFIIETYKIVKSGGTQNSGFGDIIARIKFNLFGNDAGNLAGAILPFIKIPTNSGLGNDLFEGGNYFLFLWEPAETWGVSLTLGPEWVKNAASNKFHLEAFSALSVSKSIASFAPFLEFVFRRNFEADTSATMLGGGLAYFLSENFFFDLAAWFGMNNNTADLKLATGLTWRL